MADDKVTPPSNSFDVNEAVALYVVLRDKKAALKVEHDAAAKRIVGGMEELESILLKYMEDQKAEAIRTESGVVYQRVFRSATTGDRKAFRDFVVENKEFDLLEWRPAKVAVFDYMEKKGTEVPGVKTSAYMTIGVRRGDASQQEDE